jgi:hypothetical protein
MPRIPVSYESGKIAGRRRQCDDAICAIRQLRLSLASLLVSVERN